MQVSRPGQHRGAAGPEQPEAGLASHSLHFRLIFLGDTGRCVCVLLQSQRCLMPLASPFVMRLWSKCLKTGTCVKWKAFLTLTGSQTYSHGAGHKFALGLVSSGREAMLNARLGLGCVCSWISWNNLLRSLLSEGGMGWECSPYSFLNLLMLLPFHSTIPLPRANPQWN